MASARQVKVWIVRSLTQPNNPDLERIEEGSTDTQFIIVTRKGGVKGSVDKCFLVKVDEIKGS